MGALRQMGIRHCVLEMQEVWTMQKSDPAALVQRLSRILVEQRVGAVMGYGFNGMSDVPLDPPPGGSVANLRSFWEVRGIPQLMLWLDHPQWHSNLVGLSPQLQGLFRSGNCYHYFKSAAHALEMERICGWPNCFELPAGVDPGQFPPPPVSEKAELKGGGEAEFDLVAICSEKGVLPAWLKEFALREEPDPEAIRGIVLEQVRGDLEKLWNEEVPENMRPEVRALGVRWSEMKAKEPFLGAVRHWPRMVEEFPGAAWYLTLAYATYMKALRILWRLREWERRFYVAYLSRYFRVGIFGGDWSAMKLGPGGWVDFHQQSEVYARGKVALNITDGHDEEGTTMKPWEIAASGVAMLHYHAEGLGAWFKEGEEVMTFRTPREAREKLGMLVRDGEMRRKMARAARERVLKEHTWEGRMERVLAMARLPMECFR